MLREFEEDAEIAAVIRHPGVQWVMDMLTRTASMRGRAPRHELPLAVLLDNAFSAYRRSDMRATAKEFRSGHAKLSWQHAYPTAPAAPKPYLAKDGRWKVRPYWASTGYSAVTAIIDKTPSDIWSRVRLQAYDEKMRLQKDGELVRPHCGRVLQLDAYDLDADVAPVFMAAKWRALEDLLRGVRFKLVRFRAKGSRTRSDRQTAPKEGVDGGKTTYKEALDGRKTMVLSDPDDGDILHITAIEGTGSERDAGWDMLTWAMAQAPTLKERLVYVVGDSYFEGDVAFSAKVIDRLRAIPVFPEHGSRRYDDDKGRVTGVPKCPTCDEWMELFSISNPKGGKGASGLWNNVGPQARMRFSDDVPWPLPEHERDRRWNPKTGKGGWILGDLDMRWKCPNAKTMLCPEDHTHPGDNPCVYSLLPRAGADKLRFRRAALLAHREGIESINALLRRRGNSARHGARLPKLGDDRLQWLLDAEATFLVLRKLCYLDGSYERARQEMDAYGWLGDDATAVPPAHNSREAWEERCKLREAAGEPGRERYIPLGYSKTERERIAAGWEALVVVEEDEEQDELAELDGGEEQLAA